MADLAFVAGGADPLSLFSKCLGLSANWTISLPITRITTMDINVGRRNKPRKILSAPGTIRTGRGVAHHVAIADLSESGCRVFDLSTGAKEGSTVSIRVGRLDPIYATVRWVKKGQLGLEFQQPLYGPVFENIKAILDEAEEEPDRRSRMRMV